MTSYEDQARASLGRLVLALLAVLVACSLTAASACAKPKKPKKPNPAVVVTDKGAVRGIVAGKLREFLGIPYAAPPRGKLRWRPPQPHAAWKGTRNARQFGSACSQPSTLFGASRSSENCLFLNVHTPWPLVKGAASRYPVMVWIHGGSLVTGAGSLYDPTQLVRRGVIVVTINYRLGALGFLAHPALSAESSTHASGDYGLMDQQAALRWVRGNIARFGGSPRNVTIFGQSAGGQSVHAQLASPTARGLFGKAIVESGSYALAQLPSLADAEASGTAFAAKVGCSDQTAGCLRAVPAAKLVAAEDALYLPDIDGSVVPEPVASAFAAGSFNRVPVIEGTNHDEWRLFVATEHDLAGGPVTASTYTAAIASTLEGQPASVVNAAAAEYPLSAYPSPDLALGALGTDGIFACPARGTDRAISRYVPTFGYEFNDENAPAGLLPAVSFPYGAYHLAELQYLFGLGGLPSSLSPSQRRLSRAMVGYWTQFAKTGNPNGPGLPTWPRYTAASDKLLSLVPPQPTTETTFAADHKCSFWDGLATATASRR